MRWHRLWFKKKKKKKKKTIKDREKEIRFVNDKVALADCFLALSCGL